MERRAVESTNETALDRLSAAASQEEEWRLGVETELVLSDWEEAMRGGTRHPPRPLATPIFASSTYRLESAKEGEVLSNTQAAVSC